MPTKGDRHAFPGVLKRCNHGGGALHLLLLATTTEGNVFGHAFIHTVPEENLLTTVCDVSCTPGCPAAEEAGKVMAVPRVPDIQSHDA